jgi:uncharacterized repeat protein (TIGR03803 family)
MPSCLLEGADGGLYGVTSGGGSNSTGTVFKLNNDGTSYRVLYAFFSTSNNWSVPHSLLEGTDGMLYGSTWGSGTNNAVFKLNEDGSGYTMLRSFAQGQSEPTLFLETTDGTFYGATEFDSGALFKIKRDGSGYETLHAFPSAANDGLVPNGLLQGSDGALYGTTADGGPNRWGTVFTLNQDGSGYSTLYALGPGDGTVPFDLIEGTNGALYGLIRDGGRNGQGAVFKLNKDGRGFISLYRFPASSADGAWPSTLVKSSDGTFFGTTTRVVVDGGTVFKLNGEGSAYQTLYTLSATGGDGEDPADLLEGRDGALYGTTGYGGTAGWGTVFKVNKDGSGYTVLAGPSILNRPRAVIEGNDGALYGTTWDGNSNYAGTVFKLNKDGTSYSELYSFSGGSDGSNPAAGLVQGSDGAFYGTTSGGGDLGLGTIFALRPESTPPTMLPLLTSSAEVVIQVATMAGSTNEVQRATALGTDWLSLGNIVAPASGVAQFIDTSPPHDGAYYRVLRNAP